MAAILLTVSGMCRGAEPVIVVPRCEKPLHIAMDWPRPADGETRSLRLVEDGDRGVSVAAMLVPGLNADGSVREDRGRLIATIPPESGHGTRRFLAVHNGSRQAADRPIFRFQEVDEYGLGLREGDRPILVYNHGIRSKPGIPPERNRSTYVHPIYGLDGEVLTDDFPEDHHHHRGLFWAWPHVVVEGKEYDLWLLGTGLEQRFDRWLAREGGPVAGVLGVENGWYIGARKVMSERIWLTVYPTDGDG